ncbi:MAG: methylaspartate ammonia-lyase [Pirellulales bacterium]|nr:methylaspartate ammonia-lyase [Pirellulales bacterium]
MNIVRALFVPGTAAFFFDDQRAIKGGAPRDGFVYDAAPVTPGFPRVRTAGRSLSVLLVLDDGQIAVGDCAAVQYSGAGGRDPLFLAEHYLPFLNEHVRPRLEGRPVEPFRAMAEDFCGLLFGDRPMHTALRYGLTQALLDARAKALDKLRCEVLCEEYGLPFVAAPVPVFGQTGDNRYENVDKMILKQVDALPHGLINNVEDKLGADGGRLKEYLRWLVGRIEKLKTRNDYHPTLHLDVYGTPGLIFENDFPRVAGYLAGLQDDAGRHALYIEGPVDVGEKPGQIEALKKIKDELHRLGSPVKIVADEWCNTFEDVRDFTDARACHMVQIKTPDLGGIQATVESVLYCKAHGMEAYQGGTCNETDLSAQCCVHLAMATHPERILAKPGMGFDEGFTITYNEMQRICTLLKWKAAASGRG